MLRPERPNQHQEIDARSLEMALAIARKIDESPELLVQVRQWAILHQDKGAMKEWLPYLNKPWPEIRDVLTDPGELGARLRQSSPFVGILSNQERWAFYRFAPR
jgi:hypothetical protein